MAAVGRLAAGRLSGVSSCHTHLQAGADRGAYFCFALSIIVPSAASVLMTSLLSPGGVPGNGLPGIQMMQLFNAAGPIFFGISIILVMKAIVPGFIPPQNVQRPTSYGDSPSNAGGGSWSENVTESQSP